MFLKSNTDIDKDGLCLQLISEDILDDMHFFSPEHVSFSKKLTPAHQPGWLT